MKHFKDTFDFYGSEITESNRIRGRMGGREQKEGGRTELPRKEIF